MQTHKIKTASTALVQRVHLDVLKAAAQWGIEGAASDRWTTLFGAHHPKLFLGENENPGHPCGKKLGVFSF